MRNLVLVMASTSVLAAEPSIDELAAKARTIAVAAVVVAPHGRRPASLRLRECLSGVCHRRLDVTFRGTRAHKLHAGERVLVFVEGDDDRPALVSGAGGAFLLKGRGDGARLRRLSAHRSAPPSTMTLAEARAVIRTYPTATLAGR